MQTKQTLPAKQLCQGGCGRLILVDDEIVLCYDCNNKEEWIISEILNPAPISAICFCCCCHINSVCPADGQDTCDECISKM